MYFGSVRFFKHVIVGVVILLIIVPCVFCFVLNSQLGELRAENDELKSQVGEGKITSQQTVYEPEQLFSLYKDKLDDKQGFLGLVYDDNNELYLTAAGKDEDLPANNEVITAVPVKQPETQSGSFDNTTEPEIASQEEVRPAYEQLYPDLYADVPSDIIYNADMDYVYMTFDDGPSKYTENILYYLKQYDIKATFFVVPDGSAESNARLKAIADAGHTIGIHTATHEYNKIYASVDAYLEDFKIAYDRVYEATGVKCNLFRFPGGSINDYNTSIRDDLIAEMTRRGFIYFDWNVDSSDALGATWTEMYNTVLKQTAAANRAVVLMHDYNGGYNTVLVLEDIIKALINDKRGYKFDKLTEYVKPVQF